VIISDVIRITGLSRATIYRRIKHQGFPCSNERGGWCPRAVAQWLNENMKEEQA
jgi:predicted DNA-binding transcriptional regulator AlpA